MAAAGRRTSLAALAGAKVDDVPGKSDPLLLSLPLGKLVPTRFNPRRRFGTEEELREFGQKLAKEQLQPAVVVSRAAYLKLWPGEAEHVGDASYVIANGERRYRASLLVGRPALEVVHKEDVAASRAAFLDAVQSENNDRQDLDPIERALGIDIMVTELGGADQVAVYYGKTKGWVSQQRKLLRLTPALQDLVSSAEMPVRVAREIAGLPPDVQATAWEEELERRRLEKKAAAELRAEAATPTPAERFTAVNQPTPAPETYTAVYAPAAAKGLPAPTPGPTAVQRPTSPVPAPGTAVNDPQPDGPPEHVPEPRASTVSPNGQPKTSADRQPPKLPYDDGSFVAQHLALKMDDGPFFLMLRVLLQAAQDKDPQALATLLEQTGPVSAGH